MAKNDFDCTTLTPEQRDARLALDVERLLRFGRKHKLIKELDELVARNTLLDLLQLAAPSETKPPKEDPATPAALLDAWGKKLDEALDAEDAFDAVRAEFNAQVRRREDAVTAAGDALEFAFDFMERIYNFGETGQEMVVFVNELALGPDSAPYLAENECERFEQYSQKLLLHQGDDEILAELERDDIRAEEHSTEF